MFEGMFVAARAVFPATLLLVTLFGSGQALAQPNYPSLVQKNFMIEDCTPSCGLCHLSAQGGGDRNAWANESNNGTLAALAPTAISSSADFDKDQVPDVVELQAGSDPGNGASTPETVEALSFCLAAVPQFGCGARLARGTQDDGSAVAWLVIGIGLALKLTRKRRPR